jgi:hypothetical protein
MRATDDLYQLIKSLTPSEKRYFKVFAKRHVLGEVNKYEILFDAFDAQPDDKPYDEDKLKKELTDKKLSKNFADEKKNLTEMVMKAMKSFHSGATIDSQLYELLAESDFYRDKRLNPLRRKALEKAKELAVKYERYHMLLTLIEREDAMNLELNQNTLREQAERAGMERNQLLDKMKVISILKEKSEWIFLQYRIHAGRVPVSFWDEADRKIYDNVLTEYKPGLCFTADNAFYNIWSLYYVLKGDTAEQNRYSALIYDLYETQYPQMKISNPLSYKISLYNYLNGLRSIKDFDKMKELLDFAEQIPSANEDEAGEDFQNTALFKQLYFLGTRQYDNAVDMIEWINDGVKRHKKKVNINSAFSYLMVERWDDVIDYCEEIICDKTDARIDVNYEARLYQLIARYELEQYDQLSYQIRNTQRWVDNKNGLSESYNNSLKLFSVLLKEGKPYLKKIRENITEKLSDYKGYPAVQIWLYSRVMKVSLIEAEKMMEVPVS